MDQAARITNQAIEALKRENVDVFKPGDPKYERSVITTNRLYRFSRPDSVVHPTSILDVQKIINEAVSRNITVTIKNGGHSYAGFSTAFGGILLDLKGLSKGKLDIESRTVTLEGGMLWGQAYMLLINGKHDGLIINGGRCPTVGVSGFMLGGGLGPFTRSFGMGSDTLKEATIVTADGKRVTVKDTDDPSTPKGELFWALRGAGGANFGVLVKMKLALQELNNKKGTVVAGRYTWYPKSKNFDNEVVGIMNDIYTTNWPDSITMDTTWLCDLREAPNEVGIRLIFYYDGDKDGFDRIIDQYITKGELATQIKRRALPEKSTRFLHESLDAQWAEDIRSFPSTNLYDIYTSFIFKNDKGTIKNVTLLLTYWATQFKDRFIGEKVSFQVTWIHSGGKVNDKDAPKTAFYWREAVYHTYIMIEWMDKWLERDMRGFLQEVKQQLRPHSIDGKAAFINFPDSAMCKTTHEQAYYGANREKLQRVKKHWDPNNFFNWAQGIHLPESIPRKPTVASDEESLTDLIAGQQWEFYKPKDFAAELKELADFIP
ncbi:hypothetical protein ACHAQJ_000275 [Trichoderma viride]